ncbi:MAG: DUF4347 domain-containing protein [Leptolyngbyaceae cyanobacterium]
MAFISRLPARHLRETLAPTLFSTDQFSTTTPDQVTKLVVIDSEVEGYKELVSGLLPNQDLAILHPSQDGIEQISYFLSQGHYADLAIVAHGEPGKVYLGNSVLQTTTLSHYTALLAEWGVKKIELWSCQVAQDISFVEQLATVTSATVFASNQPLGQGQWDLSGLEPLFVPDVVANWSGVLAGNSPLLGGLGSSVGAAGTAPKVLAPGLTISNFSGPSDTLDGAIVSITGNFNASADSLGLLGQSGTSGTVNGLNWNYNSTSGVLRLTGSASAATYQAALRQVAYDPTGVSFNGLPRTVNFLLGDSLPYSGNGHYYKFVPQSLLPSWDTARNAAAASNLFGLQGYLTTVTSEGENNFILSKLEGRNAWIGASDAAVNKVWRWVTGPETGQLFFRQGGWISDQGPNGIGIGAANDQPPGQYTNWNAGQPDDGGPPGLPGFEDYAFYSNGKWSDAPNTPLLFNSVQGYVVEYGGSSGDPTLQISGNVTVGLTAADGYFNFKQATRAGEVAGVHIPFTPIEVSGLQIPLLFDETYYDWKNPDVKAAIQAGHFTSGYEHFVKFGRFEGRNPSTLYNEQYYLSHNPDVAQAVQRGQFQSGLQHFLLYGNKEERNPTALFNQRDYLTGNPDVQTAVASGAFTSALDHFIEYGAAEGRVPELILFQEAFYLEQNSDVRAAVQRGAFVDGYQHYLQFGAREGRNPSPLFNEQAYRSLNPDVAAAINSGTIINGFAHYILFGREEGRPTAAVL